VGNYFGFWAIIFFTFQPHHVNKPDQTVTFLHQIWPLSLQKKLYPPQLFGLTLLNRSETNKNNKRQMTSTKYGESNIDFENDIIEFLTSTPI